MTLENAVRGGGGAGGFGVVEMDFYDIGGLQCML